MEEEMEEFASFALKCKTRGKSIRSVFVHTYVDDTYQKIPNNPDITVPV